MIGLKFKGEAEVEMLHAIYNMVKSSLPHHCKLQLIAERVTMGTSDWAHWTRSNS
jgi:hypothetical protein